MTSGRSVAAFGIAVWWLGCTAVSPPARGPLNVLLVVLDTTRSDHLGAYGYTRPTTPHLDAFAAQGALFENVISPAATTPPSLGSMFTGVLPFQHGVRAIESLERSSLDPGVTTVAEVLGGRGFETAAFVSSIAAASRYGLNRGFAVYSEEAAARAEKGQISAEQVNAELLPWLRGRPAGRPFFSLAHYFDVHDLRLRCGSPRLDRFLSRDLRGYARRIAMYDAELYCLDQELGRVFATLQDTGLANSTMVMVVADHGEGLGDHGHRDHGLLYQEQVRVPLLVRGPGIRRGLRVKQRLSALHLAPTILDLAGVPPGAWPGAYLGRSLRPWLEAGRGAADTLIFAESHNTLLRQGPAAAQKGEVYAAIKGPWKYLHYPRGAPDELFNLDLDPAELRNLRGDHPQLAAELHEPLRRLGIISPLGGRPPVLDPERLEQLRALGYVD